MIAHVSMGSASPAISCYDDVGTTNMGGRAMVGVSAWGGEICAIM